MLNAVRKSFPHTQHDPDSDNTQFETHIPLEVPINSAPAGRSSRSIEAACSKTISVSMLTYHQQAVNTEVASLPLMNNHERLGQEAEHLLTEGRGPSSLESKTSK